MPRWERVEGVAARSSLVCEALDVAKRAHAGQRRGVHDEMPFVEHPLAVGELLVEHGQEDALVAAGLLHDTLEHTDVTLEDLRRRFGERIAAIVSSVSEDRAIEDYWDRRLELRERVVAAGSDALRVFAADKIANLIALHEACGEAPEWGTDIEEDMEISLSAQLSFWQDDVDLLFDLGGEDPLLLRMIAELDSIWGRPQAWRRINDVVARAGVVTMMEFSSLEKRSVLRDRLTEATGWQDLRERRPAPVEPGVDEGDSEAPVEEIQDLDVEEDEEDEEEEEEEEDEDEEDEPRYRATRLGYEMITVHGMLQRWLSARLEDLVDMRRSDAQAAVHPLAWGWSSTVVHAFARGPLTLAELKDAVPALPADAARRCVEEMEAVGLLDRRDDGAQTRYHASDWLREAVAPLAAAAWFELHRPGTGIAAPDHLDVTAAFSLALPLLELPTGLSGSCRLGVELGGGEPRLSGVTALVEDGRIASVDPGLDDHADAWAAASTAGWIDTLLEPAAMRVRTGGEDALPDAIVAGLHERLFA